MRYDVFSVPSTTSAGNVKPAWNKLSIRALMNRAIRLGVFFLAGSLASTLGCSCCCCSASGSSSSSSSITNCAWPSLSLRDDSASSSSSSSSQSQRVQSDSSSQTIGSTRAMTHAQLRTDRMSSAVDEPGHGERGKAKVAELGRGKVCERMRRMNCVASTVINVRIFSGYCCRAVLTMNPQQE